MLVSEEGVPVSVDGDEVPPEERNTIYIKEKMDIGTQSRILSAMSHIREQAGHSSDASDLMAADLGAYQLAILKCSIVGWEGPKFKGAPCTPANIERLDPDEPLVERVLEVLNERNIERGKRVLAKSPNGVRPAGSRTSRAKDSAGQ